MPAKEPSGDSNVGVAAPLRLFEWLKQAQGRWLSVRLPLEAHEIAYLELDDLDLGVMTVCFCPCFGAMRLLMLLKW